MGNNNSDHDDDDDSNNKQKQQAIKLIFGFFRLANHDTYKKSKVMNKDKRKKCSNYNFFFF